MKLRLIAIACCLTGFFAPAIVLADDLDLNGDTRLEGFPQTARLESGGVALTWLLFIVLALIVVAVMFKDAKRSHLD